ncbi:MAG: NADH-quinone oxidoreductase subunit B [Aggregatilineales bacterium]
MPELNLQALQNPDIPVPAEMQSNIAITSLSQFYNWSRSMSVWPLLFGLACCAIEMIATAASRYDLARFGMEIMRASPRQSDLMIVSGTVTKKMIVPIVRLYNQMPEPKYVLAMGACASGGGPFKEGYNVVSGVDKFVPVDVYVPGCPPTPQALMNGLIALQKKIQQQSLAVAASVPWYSSGPNEPIPVPILGPDLIDPRQAEVFRHEAALNRQTPVMCEAWAAVKPHEQPAAQAAEPAVQVNQPVGAAVPAPAAKPLAKPEAPPQPTSQAPAPTQPAVLTPSAAPQAKPAPDPNKPVVVRRRNAPPPNKD